MAALGGTTARREGLAFAALVFIQLASVWSFDVFATQDGAVHLLNARVLFDYDDPAHEIFREFYTVSREWNPNWLGQLLLAWMLSAVDPDVAEKLLVSLFVLGLPLAMRSLLRASGGSGNLLALAVVPFVQIFPLQMGFYNFCLSLVGYTWLLGQYIRLGSSFEWTRACAFSLGCVALYFAHIVSTLALLVTIGCLFIFEAQRKTHSLESGRIKAIASIALRPLLLLTPCSLLALYFLAAEGGPAPPSLGSEVFDNASRGLLLQFFASWGEIDLLSLAPGILLLVVLVAGVAGRGVSDLTPAQQAQSHGLAVAALVLTGLALVMPRHSLAGEFITDRLLLYPIYLAVAWLGLREARIFSVGWVAPVLAMLALLAAGVAWHGQRDVNRELLAFHACDDTVPAASFLVPLTFEARGRWLGVGSPWERVDPIVHAGSRTAIRRDSISADNFTAENGNHPLIWQPGYLPRTQIGCTFCMPPTDLDLFAYPHAVDAVLLWKAPSPVPGPLGVQLRRHFQEACASETGETRLLLPSSLH